MLLKPFNKLLFWFLFLFTFLLLTNGVPEITHGNTTGLKIATFDIDVTPPVGTRLAYDSEVNKWDLGLRAKGIVLSGAGQPIVLCAVDWIGIANEGQDAFKEALADAAGTTPERIALHTVHQHDAPICDFSSEKILKEAGLNPLSYEGTFAREVIRHLREEVKNAIKSLQPVTHIGIGEAEVYQVASNRRILGDDGLVRATRYTACKDSALRAEPEGLIDPLISLISFWDEDKPLAILSYYAVHPQSYYRTGIANPDFPGLARFFRQLAVPEALHIHFNGAGGNITAGKYNDGSPENRLLLAERLADGMKRAWEATQREPVTVESIGWAFEPISLPPSLNIKEPGSWMETVDPNFLTNHLFKTAWLKRLKEGKQIDISCLRVGNARILHLPGEPFIEFQLTAKAERPDLFVAVAGYGDFAPCYICTSEAYKQGGYEAGQASGVAPEAENVLIDAIKNLLNTW